MNGGNPSRRAVFAGMAAVPVVGGLAVSPALSAGPSPFAVIYARHSDAAAAYNAAPDPASEVEEWAYLDAARLLDEAVPTNWTEFTQKLQHVLCPMDDDLGAGIIADAKRLLAMRS